MKILGFILKTFSNKEDATRAGAAGGTAFFLTLLLFTPRSEHNLVKSQTDRQQRLLWAEVAEIKNTLQAHQIYVPEIIDLSTNTP